MTASLERVRLNRAFVAVRAARGGADWQERLYLSFVRRVHEEQVTWRRGLDQILDTFHSALDLDGAIRYAASTWIELELAKAFGPNADELIERLVAGTSIASLEAGAVQIYLGMALETSVPAGQLTLDHLGLNRTFAWANERAMAQDMFAVRGSKVIQNAYGNHLERLQVLIAEATSPRHPLTIDQVRGKIAAEWPKLQRYQVEKIARTETAAVWTATQANAYAANGITRFESTLAHGPGIGVDSAAPCDLCTEMAADLHLIGGDIPPWHPNCRCEIVPILVDEDGEPWLPPQEPFTGGADNAFADYSPSPLPEPSSVTQSRYRILLEQALRKARL